MKVKDLGRDLYFGDVISWQNALGGAEAIVTWVRLIHQDGELDENDAEDFDVLLMDDNGEISQIRHLGYLDEWEYVRSAFSEVSAWIGKK